MRRLNGWFWAAGTLLGGVCFTVLNLAGAEMPPAGTILYNQYDCAADRTTIRLRAVNPDGTGDRIVDVALPEPACPTWSKDGRFVALTSADPALAFTMSRDVFVLEFMSGELMKLTAYANSWGSVKTNVDNSTVDYAGAKFVLPFHKAFSPDGRRVAVSASEVSGATYTYSTNGSSNPADYYSGTSVTPTLTIYGTDPAVLPLLVEAASISGATIHAGDGVDWAPDANLLVWPRDKQVPAAGSGNLAYVTALYLLEPVGAAMENGHARQLTFPGATQGYSWQGPYLTFEMDFQPSFSQDGKQVAYIRSTGVMIGANLPTGWSALRVVNVDGSNDHEVLQFKVGDYATHIAWSPNGTHLAFDLGPTALSSSGFPLSMAAPSTVAVYTVKLDGSGLAKLMGPAAAWPAWSPGRAFVGAPALHVAPAGNPGPGPRPIVISWPADQADYVLEVSEGLAQPGGWQPEPGTPVVLQEQATVTIIPAGTSKFYRLRQR